MTGDAQTPADESSATDRELEERLAILATFNEVISDVSETIVAATERADVEQHVCERLVQTETLRFVWIGVVEETTGEIRPTAWAGTEDGYLDEGDASVAGPHADGDGPIGRALRSGTVQTTHSIADEADFGALRDAALERGYHSAASVPLDFGDERYGVLTMYAGHEGAFTAELVEPIQNLGHTVAHGIDSHVRRERERELERREAAFSRIVDDIEEYAIFRLDADGHVESWNRGAEAIKGYTTGEILGEHVRTFYTDEDRERGLPERLLEAARRDGRAEDEGWRVRADGTQFWASVAITALVDDGDVVGFAKVTRDMTERKQRERQLDAVFNSTFQYMGLLDPDGTVLRVNDAALEVADAGRDAVVGRPAWETPWWRGDDERVSDLKAALSRAASGEFVQYEVEVDTGPDRPDAVIDFSLTPVFDGDDVVLLVPEGHDITDRKERERQLRRERERLEFVNRVIRHNLLNGLNVVGARADIVGDFVGPDGEPHLETVRNRVDEMTELVGTMRTFMKVIVERDSHELYERSIHEAIDAGLSAVDVDATGAADANISIGSVPRIPVLADELLDEVVEQLLKNAIQHNDNPTPEVHVDVAVSDERVELRVSDDGPGIPDEEKQSLLEQRIEDLSDPGNGFGLFLVREIVEGYGGELRIEDNEPTGASFVATFQRA
ncbi:MULTISPECIES: PAS domain S-box protein [Haloferax]|uniref:histidine kinase n=1 Tax=Haloferax marinum TaxID=2666143 RepID=A0A6A8G3E1_9EURY|nr:MULTISPECIES: PAS domain S-box protein [Haloferax]KAB1196414.1 PAS domain S-box protein [Haloferax sp. CBA1150]MRW95409.1 PAS domain S-box protein [Haloferax marinum]